MAKKKIDFDESDMDSLYILPLSIVPLETLSLKTAKMIKNNRLESCIEMFSDNKTGSGQVPVAQIGSICGWEEGKEPPDFDLLCKLAKLPGYDVFSLRILFRQMAIPVHEFEVLKLSEKQNSDLANYISKFTQPLIISLYGDENEEIRSYEDVIEMLRHPDTRKVKKKLSIMANSLGISVDQIPTFLESYGDLFLSISYFQKCFDNIMPHYTSFIKAMKETCENRQYQKDTVFQGTCKNIETALTDLVEKLNKRFAIFEKLVNSVWDDITPTKFMDVKLLVEGSHTVIGGALCSLTVKLNAWAQKFPNPDSSNPARISEFILNEVKPGVNSHIKSFTVKLND